MKTTIKYIQSMMLLLLLSLTAQAQDINELSVKNVNGMRSKIVSVPIYLTNTQEVTAVQFDITMPQGSQVYLDSTKVAENRRVDHIISGKSKGSNRYRFMFYSPTNQALLGNTGRLCNIVFKVYQGLDDNETYNFKLSNIVMSDLQGNPIEATSVDGHLTLQSYPDFEVSNFKVTNADMVPGGSMTLSWTVKNIGETASTGGWKENFYLTNESGTQVPVSNNSFENTGLAPGESIQRSIEVTLPQVLGIDGNVFAKVAIKGNSDSGERSEQEWNNSATAETGLNLTKQMTLTMPEKAVSENYRYNVSCQIARSGNRNTEETFTLTCDKPDRLEVPATVTIGRNAASANFYVKLKDNTVYNEEDTIVVITAKATGYADASALFIIEDNEYPQMTLTTSKEAVSEGETFQLTVTLPKVAKEDVQVNFTSDDVKRFDLPASVIIAQGEKSASINVTAIDNEKAELELTTAFYATAEKYEKAQVMMVLEDNDMPELEMTFSPTTVTESAGLAAVKVQLVRKTLTDRDVTIQMSDDSENGEIYYAQKRFTMKAGVTTAEFAIGIVDNANVDGNRTVKVTAGVWATSCNCTATGSEIGAATVELTILDDDGPSLSVTSSSSSLLEGKENATTLTVKRNTGKKGTTVVTITSDREEDLEYNHTITIPDGQETASVSINAKKNSVADDERTVVFTVSSDGFTQGTCWALITDQSRPDATVNAIELAESNVPAAGMADVTVTVNNVGNEPLPVQTKVNIYMDNALLTTLYTMEEIAAGESGQITQKVSCPDMAGEYQLKAVVNEDKKVKELVYINNTSPNTPITLTASFTATVEVDKDIYQAYEDVEITGLATGSNISNRTVEICLMLNGIRDTLLVTTDATGNFSRTYNPRGVAGHYEVGACYVGDQPAQWTSFDVYGMKLTSSSFLKYEPSVGIPYEAKVSISNTGALPLHNVRMKVVSMGDEIELNQTPIATLEGNKKADLAFNLTGKVASSDNKWQQLNVKFTSDEGATFDGIIYYYNRVATGKIRASISSIKTTMIKGQSRDYVFDITNIGQGETGKITLALPEGNWMVASTGKEMSSLATNDTTQIVLRLTPTADMQLNVPQRGTIGINCENGEGMPLSFVIEPVSESTGRLIVDVCDEYTYYTDEKPHVKGAKVTVSHPTTGAVIAQGETGEDGKFIVDDLNEGYYTLYVTAEKHESYRNNILIDPGVDNERVINLSYQAVTVTWNVVETTVEDEYEIVTTTTFETHVPKPVVTIRGPEKLDIDAMEVGSSQILYYTLTNEGLINALNTTFEVPTGLHEVEFEALANVGPFTLAPHQAVQIPVRVTRFSDGSIPSGGKRRAESAEMQKLRDCFAGFSAYYEVMCGKDMKNDRALVSLALRACVASLLMQGSGGGDGSSLGNPGGGSGSYYTGGSYGGLTANGDGLCDPDVTDAANSTITYLGGKAPGIGPFISKMSEAEEQAANMAEGKVNAPKLIETGLEYGGPMLDAAPVCKGPKAHPVLDNPIVKTVKEYGEEIKNILEIRQKWEKVRNKNHARALDVLAEELGGEEAMRKASSYSWYDAFANVVYKYNEQLDAAVRLQEEYYGDSIWWAQPTFDPTIETFFQRLQIYDDYQEATWHQAAEEHWTMNTLAEQLIKYMEDSKPQSVTMEQMKALVKRIRCTAHSGGSPEDRMDLNVIRREMEYINELDNEAIINGYPSMTEWFFQAAEDFKKAFHEASSNSVCVNIKIEFKQKMVLTRQAFRGTLTVKNGNEEAPMTDVKLALKVTDEAGNVATTHEFQIEPESLDGFTGELKGNWELAPNAQGTATILFIPTKYAAPTEEKLYNFGGSLTYTDPYTGLTVTRDLSPVTLTVKPSPNLDLTYFMQRDIWGDDALTTDKVEPMEEAEFALLINNVGNGEATNVRMTTEQPKVVENEKGLLIDLELISSQLNGGYKTLALGGSVPTNFGNIPAHSTTYAQWWWQSSLMGHFTEYDVKATHLTSYGNEDLSLLNNVEIHELIRSLNTKDEATGKALKAWLVNDVTDFNDTPDMLYLSDGTTEKVDLAVAAQTERKDQTHYTLTVTPRSNGWHYGNVIDPTLGRATIKRVVRGDGVVIDPRNVWQTDRTLRDGMDPLYEFRIHFADKLLTNGADQTYEITFEPKPTVPLTVASVDGLPTKNEVSTQAVGEMTIHFNKDVRDFQPENIRLECQGVKQTEAAVVKKVDAQTYTVNYPTATTQSGYFVMLVYTSKMTDSEGYHGEYDAQSIWTQFVDGQCKVTTVVTPEGAGSVTPASGVLAYGETAQLKATPNAHYTFKQWRTNDEVLTTNAQHNLYVDNNYMLYAEFVPRQYAVTLDHDPAAGTVEGIGTSNYEYGTKLSITAKPAKDYTFEGWQVNGKTVSKDATYELTVSGVTDVKPLFSYTPATLTINYNLVKGWNWIYVNPADESQLTASTLFATIADHVQEVRGPSGEATTLSPENCYQVLVDDDVTLEVETRVSNASSPVSLKKGWNWICYRPFETLDVNTALVNFAATEGNILKGQDGFAVYDGTQWTGSLNEMHPGQGYQLYAPYSTSFTYPTTALTTSCTVETNYDEVMNAPSRGGKVTTLPDEVDRRKYANNMCVVADVKKNEVVSNSETYLIGAFVGDECRGISRLIDDKYFITIYGNDEEEVEYNVFDSTKREYINTQGGSTFSDKAAANVKVPTEVVINEATSISELTEEGGVQQGTYNLAGQQVDENYKGIVIIDGKKVVIK
ncbi:MAG: DUF5006 domain-containing protein [Bacteroidaceae bacterium]|nr:DUF5006 domain-containing protein [Bacteroidaceae bacterium]